MDTLHPSTPSWWAQEEPPLFLGFSTQRSNP
jgi:hypothetical protein